MYKIKILLLSILIGLGVTKSQANTTNASDMDSVRISLLTCAPGSPIYTLFGHTAIRYENPSKGIDAVFNYGLFSFNQSNFIWRFSLGETDYQLGIESFERFKWEYDYFERDVWQQTLNLTSQEKASLIAALEENAQPANRIYRYNFFYDNCATRPRDKIEESILGEVIYQPFSDNGKAKTFRDVIYQYTQNNPWSRFGMDFCVGSEADRPISDRLAMFAPFYLKEALDKATIKTDSTQHPLVLNTTQVVWADQENVEHDFTDTLLDIFTPIRSALLLFIIVAALTIYGIKHGKGYWWLDLILFAAAGLSGCVIAFLALFSTHPAVSQNYLLFVFHPGQLLFLPFIVIAVRKRQRSWYHVFNFVVLTLFIVLFPLIPQRINLAIVPLALCLLIRSLSNLILTYKKHK